MTFENIRNRVLEFRLARVSGGIIAMFVFALGAFLVTEWTGWHRVNEAGPGVSSPLAEKNTCNFRPLAGLLLQEGIPMSPCNIFHASTLDNYLVLLAARKAQEMAEKARMAVEAEARRKEAQRISTSASQNITVPAVARSVVSTAKLSPPRFVVVNFQGLIKMSDGQEFALIGVTPGGLTKTCVVGESCLGAVVDRLSRDELCLKLRDGEECVVTSGGSQRIEEKRIYAQ